MRVNRPQWSMPQQGMHNQPMQQNNNMLRNPPQSQASMPQQNAQRQNQQHNTPQKAANETAAMQLARKIKSEQGDKAAGYFLYAIRQFIAPHEISHIEYVLHIKSERDPRETENKNPQQNNGANMLQLLMNTMQGGKPDPMSIMRMMGKMNTANSEKRNA